MISILLPLMMLVVYGMNNYQINNTFSGEWFKFNYWFDILFCIVFTFFFYTLCILFSFTLGKRFEKFYLPKVIKRVETIVESHRKCIPENIKQRNKIELIFRQKG
jgi:predicted membrane protein